MSVWAQIRAALCVSCLVGSLKLGYIWSSIDWRKRRVHSSCKCRRWATSTTGLSQIIRVHHLEPLERRLRAANLSKMVPYLPAQSHVDRWTTKTQELRYAGEISMKRVSCPEWCNLPLVVLVEIDPKRFSQQFRFNGSHSGWPWHNFLCDCNNFRGISGVSLLYGCPIYPILGPHTKRDV